MTIGASMQLGVPCPLGCPSEGSRAARARQKANTSEQQVGRSIRARGLAVSAKPFIDRTPRVFRHSGSIGATPGGPRPSKTSNNQKLGYLKRSIIQMAGLP